jgi:glycerate-2-kinase
MTAALNAALVAAPLSGVVSTRHDHAVPAEDIEIIEASHPTPDAGRHYREARYRAARPRDWRSPWNR